MIAPSINPIRVRIVGWASGAVLSLAGCVTEEQRAAEKATVLEFAEMSHGSAVFYVETALSLARACRSVDEGPALLGAYQAMLQSAPKRVKDVNDDGSLVLVLNPSAEDDRDFARTASAFRDRHGLTGNTTGNACDIANAEIRAGTPIGRLLR